MTLTTMDLAQIERDLLLIRDEWSHSVAFRRRLGSAETTTAVQTVRIARQSGGRVSGGEGSEETRSAIVVIGAKTLDIAVGDRFTIDGALYRVTAIHPDRRAFTQASADLAQ